MASGATDYWASSSNKMSAMLDSILAGLHTGSDMLNALGAIDMAGVVAALETGSDLVAKLDNLDGKVDGKLDLDKIGGTFVDAGGVTLVAKLQASIDELTDAVTELGTIKDRVDPKITTYKSDYERDSPGTEAVKLTGVYPTRYNLRIWNWLNSHEKIYVGHNSGVNQTSYDFIVEKGARMDTTMTSEIWIWYLWSGIYYFTYWDTG